MDHWDDIITSPDQAAEQPLAEPQQARLRRLCAQIAGICRESGCTCLARRFEALASGNLSCPACSNQELPGGASVNLLPFVCKLGPLTRALADAGYYDIALLTVELAASFEPTLENDLSRAYLYTILGETEAANSIYQATVQRRGDLPIAELERLAELVRAHADEEDIRELLSNMQNPGANTAAAQ